jgi:plasmid stabilization system protein ParE
MVTQQYEVLWNTMARKQVKKIYDYILQDSLQNAGKVVNDIADAVEKLKTNPERFGLDKYKKNNNGSYRYFELYSYRIAYRIYKTYIRILRVRSTDQEPLEY